MSNVKEWEKRNVELLERMIVFEKQYRENHCMKKTSAHQQTGCHEVAGEIFCPALKKAKMRKFKKEIDQQLSLASILARPCSKG